MTNQQISQFLFRITLTDIVSNNKIKTNLSQQKSILIKLGNKQKKCKGIGQSIQMKIDVNYSKNSNKFSPVKGIIKVYDINKDGSEMISCVGAFHTDDLLTQNPKTTNISRDIGPCKIYLKIQVQKIDKLQTSIPVDNQVSYHQPTKNKLLSTGKQSQTREHSLKKITNKFMKSSAISQNEYFQIPSPHIIDDSNDQIEDQAMMKCSQSSQQFRRNEKQLLGQELVQQRRKNKILEDRIEKSNTKIQLLRKSLTQKTNEIRLYCSNFRNFTVGLQSDSKGQYIFQMNQRKREVSLRYRQNIKFKQIFQDFIAFIIKKMAENGGGATNDKIIEQQWEMNRLGMKLQNLQNEKQKHVEENNKLINQLISLRQELNMKKGELASKDQNIRNKIEEISVLEDRIRKLGEEKKQFQGLNQYLQERDIQMQSIILSKQNTIQNLTKIITENDTQLRILEQKSDKFSKIIDNLQLTIQEMKQQNANLSQTIDGYRQRFGDLKQVKDKALEREIKQCLRWIDQQNRDEQLSLQDTTLTFSQAPAVTSIMRSIGEIQNMPLEQIALIRKEVIGVLKRLDQFVAKNSLGGVSS